MNTSRLGDGLAHFVSSIPPSLNEHQSHQGSSKEVKAPGSSPQEHLCESGVEPGTWMFDDIQGISVVGEPQIPVLESVLYSRGFPPYQIQCLCV